MANIDGNGNTINMNSVDDLIKNYNDLVEENKILQEKNNQYFDENKTSKERLEVLENAPTVELKNMGLCINGGDIGINNAIINGTDYFSKEFIDNLVSDDTSITIKNETMFLGKVIAERADLFSQVIIDQRKCNFEDTATDSYGNTRTNTLQVNYGASIIFNLNKKYSLLKFKIAIHTSSNKDSKCTISLFADDQEVKVISDLNKITTQELVFDDIDINNCTKLEIKSSGDQRVYPLIYDAEVYN